MGFWTDANGPANKVTYTNCVAVGWTGAGATHRGFTKYPGTTGSVRNYNGTAYRLRDWLRERCERHDRQELRGGELRERLQRHVRRGVDQQRQ